MLLNVASRNSGLNMKTAVITYFFIAVMKLYDGGNFGGKTLFQLVAPEGPCC